MESCTNWCTGISSIAVTPSVSEVVDDRRVREPGVGAAQVLGDAGVALRHALDVRLVDDRLVVRGARAAGRRPSRRTG